MSEQLGSEGRAGHQRRPTGGDSFPRPSGHRHLLQAEPEPELCFVTTASEVSTAHCADVETEAGPLWATVQVNSLTRAVSYRAGQGTGERGEGGILILII